LHPCPRNTGDEENQHHNSDGSFLRFAHLRFLSGSGQRFEIVGLFRNARLGAETSEIVDVAIKV
jgi:hypothetical protein